MTNWPGGEFELAPGPIKSPVDDPWHKENEFDTAGPPHRGASPASKGSPFAGSSGFEDQPLMFREPEPLSQPPSVRPIPPRSELPRLDSFQSNPPTPPGSYGSAQPARPARPVRPPAQPRDEFKTVGFGGGLELGAPNHLWMLQFYDGVGHWRELEQIQETEHVIGRSSFRKGTPATEFLAAEHLRIVREGEQLFVEEGETLNGVYRKVPAGKPVELTPGTRFQVGQHVIEFQSSDPPELVNPLVSKDGETLRWRRLEPLAYLDFIGPDNRASIRFPLTKLDGTVIGREGDIALTGDTWASRSHAKVVHQGDQFTLEDLGSTNGTFVRITGRTPIKPGKLHGSVHGDILMIGAVLIRVVEI